MELKRQQNETLEQYLWRIGNAKDNNETDLKWKELADIINPQFFDDEADYLGDSAFRKRYATAKKFYEDVFSQIKDDDAEQRHLEMLSELRRERQKLSDERAAVNRQDRNLSRVESNLAYLEELIKSTQYEPITLREVPDSVDKDIVICISDMHYGMDVTNAFGAYNTNIARERIQNYLNQIIDLTSIHQIRNAYVLCCGDLISGRIHVNTMLENRQNAVEQVQGAAELLSEFVYNLSKYFKMVFVNGIAGNHSRLNEKNLVLRDERLDNLIPWYMKAKLANISNVDFIDDYNYDATIGTMQIRGKEYLIVHGDYDSFSEAGVSKLVMLLGRKPEAIFYGHLHHNSFDTISDINIIRSGCFAGAVDDYNVSKRLSGKPAQMVAIVSDKGVETLYPINLR